MADTDDHHSESEYVSVVVGITKFIRFIIGVVQHVSITQSKRLGVTVNVTKFIAQCVSQSVSVVAMMRYATDCYYRG